MDRHQLWRKVRGDYTECKRRAPTGYEPVVEVTLAGFPDPITLGFVQTSRRNDYPYVRFETEIPGVEGGDPDAMIPPDGCWIHVHESAVLAVMVRFRRQSVIASKFTWVEEPGTVDE